MGINKEIPIGLTAATAFLYPEKVMSVVDTVTGLTTDIIDKGSTFLGSNAPLVQPAMAGLGGAKLTQFGLDKIGVESKLWRYPLITAGAYYAATSVAAPYFAAGAGLYYTGKYGYKLGKGVLSKAGEGLKSIGASINPFKGKSA